MIYVVLTIVGVIVVAVAALAPLFLLLYVGEHALNAAPGDDSRALVVGVEGFEHLTPVRLMQVNPHPTGKDKLRHGASPTT